MKLSIENIFDEFGSGLVLVTAKNNDKYNTMTIAWGSLGTVWSRPICNVYVKKNRYTHEFMENAEYFTVSFFTSDYKNDLAILGSKSGRDGDKVALTSLTPIIENDYVYFKEARYTLVMKKLYAHDFDVNQIPEEIKDHYYSAEPEHTMYVGEVIDIKR